MAPAVLSNSILAFRLEHLRIPYELIPVIKVSLLHTTERILVLVFCKIFNDDQNVSHTGSWDDIQRLLTFIHVEATRIAQENDRILLQVDVLLRGTDKQVELQESQSNWDHLFYTKHDLSDLPLPGWMHSIPATKLDLEQVGGSNDVSESVDHVAQYPSAYPSTFPVVALGGTFDHIHSGHKILLSMAAWIASEKIIVGVTDDALLGKKSNKEVMEKLPVRIDRVRQFLALFKPGLEYEIVPITDVYGPTGWDPNIQALVVSKETLNGASAIAKHREERSLPPLRCFVIDVISSSSANLEFEDAEMLRQAKLSSTFIRDWIVARKAKLVRDI
ncbi:Nucleotidylyl transferase [Rickenella mellea]|uniref:Nucleotidylyl transferase n=1 Tax=Rickenella mellea TaxID=50990 RepID=A0A4Y7QKI9_9AGAM|nr:Nucleotidylyl transferase [Rickenella mellea]